MRAKQTMLISVTIVSQPHRTGPQRGEVLDKCHWTDWMDGWLDGCNVLQCGKKLYLALPCLIFVTLFFICPVTCETPSRQAHVCLVQLPLKLPAVSLPCSRALKIFVELTLFMNTTKPYFQEQLTQKSKLKEGK